MGIKYHPFIRMRMNGDEWIALGYNSSPFVPICSCSPKNQKNEDIIHPHSDEWVKSNPHSSPFPNHPTCPLCSVSPVAPSMPGNPVDPVAPVCPSLPGNPLGPGGPDGPVTPVWPCRPGAPGKPTLPGIPPSPFGPEQEFQTGIKHVKCVLLAAGRSQRPKGSTEAYLCMVQMTPSYTSMTRASSFEKGGNRMIISSLIAPTLIQLWSRIRSWPINPWMPSSGSSRNLLQ